MAISPIRNEHDYEAALNQVCRDFSGRVRHPGG